MPWNSRSPSITGPHSARPRPHVARKGALRRRAKRKSAAKAVLEQALAKFVGDGAGMWADRTRDELSRIGLSTPSRRRRSDPRTARVAELVASGMSNREVADTLYMSVRTSSRTSPRPIENWE